MADFTGTAADDTFRATAASFQALDSIDGGEGTDTLSVVDTAAFAGFAGATITGIETVSISSGAIGAIRAKAGTTTSATPPVSTIVLSGTYAVNDTIKVTVGGQEVIATVGAVSATDYSGRAEAAAAIIAAINGKLGDAVTVGSVVHDDGTAGTAANFVETAFSITSRNGTSLPSISVAKEAVAATASKVGFASETASQTTALAAKTVTDGVQATATTAVKQQTLITIDVTSVTGSTTGVIKLVVDGSEFTRTATGASATIVAADVAELINSVLGAGSATSALGVVTVTAATAGVALPALTLSFSGYTGAQPGDTHNYSIANVVANAVETAAVGVAAPTGVTSFTAAAAGVANVSAATTSKIDVSGTAVRSSGGSDVTVTASNSVHVSGAKGEVTVKTGTTSTAMVGAVAADTATGTAGDAAGVYVTGGTNVTITGTSKTTDVKVGTAPFTKASVNETGGLPQVNGSASSDPTGDVSITRVTATASTVTGLVSSAWSTNTAKVYMNGGSTATVRGAGNTDIVDVKTLPLLNASGVSTIGTSTLATVNLSGLNTSAVANITSDAISTVSVTNSRLAATVNVLNSGETGANSGPINYVLSNVGTSGSARFTLVDNTTGTVNISSGAASTYTGSRNTGSESFVTISSTKATAINLTNSLAVNLGDVQANAAKVATVNGGSATGSVSLTIGTTGSTPEQGLSVTTGSGNDTVTVNASSSLGVNATTAAVTTVNLGAGNDALLNLNGAPVTVTGAAFNGGEGIDTVAASFINAGNAAQFVNFELLGLDRATATTTDVNLLSGVIGLVQLSNASLSGNTLTAGTVTYTGVKASQGLTVVGSPGVLAAGVTALGFEAAVITGTADSYTVGFAGLGTTSATADKIKVQAGVISLAGIETVNVVSGSAAGFTANEINLVNDDATKLVLSGSQDLKVDFGATDNDDGSTLSTNYFGTTGASTDTKGVALIDGSGMTGKLTIDTTDVGTAFAGLTVKGGSGNDTITLAQAATVEAGAGDDTIVVSSEGAIVSGGAGKDTFDVTAAVSGSTSVVTAVTDLAAGDVIKGLTAGAAASLLGAKADVSAATTLAGALELANGAAGTTAGTFWFQYGGNTYILEDALDVSSASGGFGAEDTVVQITGLFDLSNSVWGTSGLLTIA